jgi:U3 small nucleolar RNA-associated protein 23
MRQIPAIPLIYSKRSVIVLEPLSDATAKVRQREEVVKYRDGIKPNRPAKRKRDEEDNVQAGEKDSDDEAEGKEAKDDDGAQGDEEAEAKKKKKKQYGRKGPNPLAMKKTKQKPANDQQRDHKLKSAVQPPEGGAGEDQPQKKRKRRKKNPAVAEASNGDEASLQATTETPIVADGDS